jgi:antitoxin Phd
MGSTSQQEVGVEDSQSYTGASQTSQLMRFTIMRRSKKAAEPAANQPSKAWQLQTAKARFSELFRRARNEGPQVVTRQGKEQVVVLPVEQFERLTKRARQPRSLVQFFAESPLAGLKLDLRRSKDPGREVKL